MDNIQSIRTFRIGSKSSERQRLYRSVAFVTGSFSIVLGALFLFGGVSYLPNLEAMIGG
ncbi:MAG: hypothetical protein K8F55_13900 [Candidatus Methanoperedens nitroreducens]|nr:hypothetical protein [Candidatus Methanoperedens nitroreducens]